MSIPHCFDNLLGAKPKHPRVGEISAAPLPVEEVAPPSQIPGLNLTQSIILGILDQIWLYIYLDVQLGPAGQKPVQLINQLKAP